LSGAVEVVGLGLITTDYLYRIPRLPAFGSSLRASGYQRACGGPAATAMACLARLGVATRFVGKTGTDHEGEFVAGELARHGVDISRLRRAIGASRVATVLVDEDTGERGFMSWPESFAPLSVAEVDETDVTDARVLLVDDADDVGIQAARWARDAGIPVVFDGTWQSDRLHEFLPLVDHAIVGEFFASRWLPDADEETVLQQLTDLGATTAVLTLGARGSRARSPKQQIDCPAFPIDVVDTTGAGDAFHGGYIAAMLDGAELAERLRFASVTAALNCRGLGGQAMLPTRAEVDVICADQKAWPTPK
jgi:sulfofructose kinase